MKTKEELTALNEETEILNKKLAEKELSMVTGGVVHEKPFTFYDDVCRNSDIQVGNYFANEYCGGRLIIVYRLESKTSASVSSGIATKYTAYINTLPNYTVEHNVSVSLAAMSRIYKPDWIIE